MTTVCRKSKGLTERLRKYGISKKMFYLLFVVHWIIGFAVFTAYPMFQTIVYSFSKTRALPNASLRITPVGFANYYEVLFVDPRFKLALLRYMQQIFFLVPIIIIFSIIIAVLLNVKMSAKRIFRAIFFLPVILTSGPLLVTIQQMGATQIPGLRNFVVFQFIQERMSSMVSTPIMYISLNFVYILWFSGVQILIFLSAMQKVDKNIYNAAMVDGASQWQAFWKITLPILKPFVFLNTIYTVVDLSTSSLNPFQSIIKDSMFSSVNGFGFSAAVSWLFFLMIVGVLIPAFLLLRNREPGRKEKL